VVFSYQPASARIGVAITGLSLLVLVLLLGLWPAARGLVERGGSPAG
jgi:hypothetical protein